MLYYSLLGGDIMLKATLELLLAVCIVLIGKRLIGRISAWHSFKKMQLTEREMVVFIQKLENFTKTKRLKSEFTDKEHLNIALFASVKLNENMNEQEKYVIQLCKATITKMAKIACKH